MAGERTRKREVAAPNEAMSELGLKSGPIVTRNEEGRVEVAGGRIEIKPGWRFLLDLPEA